MRELSFQDQGSVRNKLLFHTFQSFKSFNTSER